MEYKKIKKIKDDLTKLKNKDNFIKELLELNDDEQILLIASITDDSYDYDVSVEEDEENNEFILDVLKDLSIKSIIKKSLLKIMKLEEDKKSFDDFQTQINKINEK